MCLFENVFEALYLCGHHVLRPIGHEGGNAVGGRHRCVEVGVRQSQGRQVEREHAAHYRLVPLVRADKGEVLHGEECECVPGGEHHGRKQHLEGDLLVPLHYV